MKLSYITKARNLNKKIKFLSQIFGNITLSEMIRKINA